MFKCAQCNRTTVPKEKATHVTVEMRKVTYPCGATGKEIVKEILVCQQCIITKLNSEEPDS